MNASVQFAIGIHIKMSIKYVIHNTKLQGKLTTHLFLLVSEEILHIIIIQ